MTSVKRFWGRRGRWGIGRPRGSWAPLKIWINRPEPRGPGYTWEEDIGIPRRQAREEQRLKEVEDGLSH